MDVEILNSQKEISFRESAEHLKEFLKFGIVSGAEFASEIWQKTCSSICKTFDELDSILSKTIKSENVDNLNPSLLLEIAKKYRTPNADGAAIHINKEGNRVWMMFVLDKKPLDDSSNVYVVIRANSISQELQETLETDQFTILSLK